MVRIVKWVAAAAALGALVLIGVAMALQQWLRTDGFRARVEAQASAALGVPLKLGRLSVDLWPLPAVAAEDVRLLTRPPLTVGRIEARPSWLPLVGGRLEIATLIVRKAALPETAIAFVGAAMQKKDKPSARGSPKQPEKTESGSTSLIPRRAVLDQVTWIDAKGTRMTVNAEVGLDDDGLLDEASFEIVQGRFVGTKGAIERKGSQWPIRVDIGGGHITGNVQLQGGKTPGVQLLVGQLSTEKVEISALTAPGKPLTGKLQALTTLRAEFRDAGQLADVLKTETRFTVRNAVLQNIDLQKAVQTVGLSRGGTTQLDVLAGTVNTQGKTVHLTNLVATSGMLSANGSVSIAANKALSGRVVVDLSGGTGAMGVPLVVGGTTDDPSVTLTRGAMVGAALGTLIVPGAGTAAGASAGDRIGDSLKGLFGGK
ncbi:MAG: AsmA family protein [Ramlibacter sp.]|nr:AsmA family protein [Ramlibacter sp.]